MAAHAPNVSGKWSRKNDRLEMDIKQDRDRIGSTFQSPSHLHVLAGDWSVKGYFQIRIRRSELANDSVTEMMGELRYANEDQLQLDINGTDGQADLPVGYKERSIWTRSAARGDGSGSKGA